MAPKLLMLMEIWIKSIFLITTMTTNSPIPCYPIGVILQLQAIQTVKDSEWDAYDNENEKTTMEFGDDVNMISTPNKDQMSFFNEYEATLRSQ